MTGALLNPASEFAAGHQTLIDELFDRINESHDQFVELIRETAHIPAPTFHEELRGDFVLKAFESAGLRDTLTLEKGSILGFTRSADSDDALLLAAHIDHVFPPGTDLSSRIEGSNLYGPGTGDNAANVAALIILARLLRDAGILPDRNIAFCGTVCEEGNGNLAGISEVIGALAGRLHAVIAVDGGASSVVNASLAIRRYLLYVKCRGGHSWGQFGSPSAIHEMARIIKALDSQELPSEVKTTYNVGTIRGGTSVNAIAQECEAEIDLRSLEEHCLEELEGNFLRIVQNARTEGVQVSAELIGDRPAAMLPTGHSLVTAAMGAASHLGFDAKLASSSTDAALALARGIPAISFGIYRGGGGHTLEEFIELDSLTAGLKWLALTVLSIAGVKR